MSERGEWDQLQPCLFDRLVDEDRSSSRESRDQRVVSLKVYRGAVLRDLAWLLNGASPVHLQLEDFPEAARSVLNHGIRDFCGTTASEIQARSLEYERMIRDAIKAFEPRIIPETLKVTVHADFMRTTHNSFKFEVAGDLWAEPIPEPLYVKTEVDLETGQCRLER